MRTEEARECWGMIVSIYDLHPERAADSSKAWVTMLVDHDADAVMTIISSYMDGKGPDKMPSLVTFVNDVKAIESRRAAERDRAERPVEQYDGLAKPVWVIAWDILRKERGDMRALPEQEGGYRQQGYPWPPEEGILDDAAEYDALMEEARSRPNVAPPGYVDVEPSCVTCLDVGWVEVWWVKSHATGWGKVGGDSAPCPACDKGRSIEQPLESVGPWGDLGFWRGQKWAVARSGVVEIQVSS